MTSTTSTDHATVFRARAHAFGALLDADLSGPSPCEGWTGADVVEHVVSTQRDFLARHDLLPDAVAPDGDARGSWTAHLAQVSSLLDGGAADREIQGWFGPTTVGELLATFYGFDLVVHRWDVGQASGVDVRWTEEEMAAVEASITQFGEQMYSEGICAPAREAPADADRQQRILALTGR